LALARREKIAKITFFDRLVKYFSSGTIVGLAVALFPLKMLKNPTRSISKQFHSLAKPVSLVVYYEPAITPPPVFLCFSHMPLK
jgi:hypothetical protein